MNSSTSCAHTPFTLLVTGGAGFIGSNFVELATAKGHKVIVLDKLTYAGSRANLEDIAGDWQLVEGDIGDTALVTALLQEHQPRWVVNFAAESHVDNSIEAPADFIETNIVGCYHLLEAVRAHVNQLEASERAGFRFLHVSTDEVYGTLGEEGRFSETSPMQPNSPYSASKAASDHLCRAWVETYGMPIIVTNCTNNYGPKQYPEKLIPLVIAKALAGEKLPVYGDGSNIRDWIEVTDHCRGIYRALEQGAIGETYGFGGDSERNNLQVVQGICSVLDALQPRKDGKPYSEQIAFVTDRAGHDYRYAMDSSKAERKLGFTRNYRFEEGLRATVEWYVQQRTKQGKAA